MSKKLKIIIAAALLLFSNEYFSSEAEAETTDISLTPEKGPFRIVKGLGSGAHDAEFATLHVAPKYKNSLSEKQFIELSENSSIPTSFLQYAVFEGKIYSVVFPKGLGPRKPNVELLGEISVVGSITWGENEKLIYYIEKEVAYGKKVDLLKVEEKIPNSTESIPLKELYGKIITPQECR